MRILKEGGRLADRYTLVRRLNAGAIHEVWLAADRLSDTRLVLKCLVGDAVTDSRQKELLRREWAIGSYLMHANIVRVFEFHDDPEGVFFSLQYVGETNIGVLAGTDPAESMSPIVLIVDALRYAHGKNVVHRDIKGSNILLDTRGIPYLVDFGVAAVAGSDEISGSGSPVSMSPEQQAAGVASSSDDIFSLGIVMHELLAGFPPTGHDSIEKSALLPDGTRMPNSLVSLLNEMLAKEASSRPNAETILERLARAGFMPGFAPKRFVSGLSAVDEVFQSVDSVRKFRRAEPHEPVDTVVTRESKGVRPKVLFSGLALGLAMLVGIIFMLPRLIEQDAEVSRQGVTGNVGSDLSEESLVNTDLTKELDAIAPSNDVDYLSPAGSGAAGVKAATDNSLGDLLSQLERLRYRAIDRWGGQPYLDAVDVYGQGDEAYISRNYTLAGEKYRQATEMLKPFFSQIEAVFEQSMAGGKEALESGNASEAVRLFDLAASITPGNRLAETNLRRAMNLDSVLSLLDQGMQFEVDLELAAAKLAFEKALEIDAMWEPAAIALERVLEKIKELAFEQSMTEGFEALVSRDFDTARAAFNVAKRLYPNSRESADGLLQVEQEVRLSNIRRLEREVKALVSMEQWENSIAVYEEILKIDSNLEFANQGLLAARSRTALHGELREYIDDPDKLSNAVHMQGATKLLLDIILIEDIGARLESEKNELTRLLKRAATPLRLQLVSDGMTAVSVYKVGRFGAFFSRELQLRPGNYVAIGVRAGYRDVRVEFRVAPEIDIQPIVVSCEEAI